MNFHVISLGFLLAVAPNALGQGGPLTNTRSVTAGLPVASPLSTRPVAAENETGGARIRGTNSPAHLAARKLTRGVNLGNDLEAPPGQNWGATYSTRDFVWIRKEGFDHVRLPIAWQFYTGPAPDYTLSTRIFAKADFLVTNALHQGLGVIVDLHQFDRFSSEPIACTNQFYAIWRQVAAHYSNAPPALVFELINEPRGAATTEILNAVYAEAIRQIREISPTRTIIVGPGDGYDRYCDDVSRVNFYRAFREAADELGLGWAMWDWKAGFHYWKEDGTGGAPDPPGMREALFPRS